MWNSQKLGVGRTVQTHSLSPGPEKLPSNLKVSFWFSVLCLEKSLHSARGRCMSSSALLNKNSTKMWLAVVPQWFFHIKKIGNLELKIELKHIPLQGFLLHIALRALWCDLSYTGVRINILTAYLVLSHSVVSNSATPWIAACQASLSITNSWSLLKLMIIESVMPYSHLILCRPLLLLPPIPPSIMVFSNESTLQMRWPKYWSFSFSISPSNEHPGLISFRMDWLDLPAVQGTLFILC